MIRCICCEFINFEISHIGWAFADISHFPVLNCTLLMLQEMQHARGMMEDHLQMPPVMQERPRRSQVLAENPEIAPVLTSKYVFIDISEKKKELSVRFT